MPPELPSLPSSRPAEARALAAAAEIGARHSPQRVLCTTAGRAQAAAELAAHHPAATVSCWFLDQFQERLAAEAAVRESEALLAVSNERLTNVLESSPDAFIALDHTWRCTYANRKAADLSPSVGNLVGKPAWDVLADGQA